MDRLIFTALSAARSNELNRVQLTNDLANLSTTGYKKATNTTVQSVYVDGPGLPTRFQPILSSDVDRVVLESGPIGYTGNDTDIAMNDQTVLGVQAPDGSIAFTRRGDLRVTATGLMVNGAGHVVMGEGEPITVPPGFLIDIAPDGAVFATDPAEAAGEPTQIGSLMLRDASNTQLTRRSDALYEVLGSAGAGGDFETGPNPAAISVGALEGSNANPVEIMVSLLDLYRSFEMQLKIIKKTEEMDQDGARMIGLR
jgi:flagellar basal-body rod protein FlgF